MSNLDSILKSRDITLPTKVHLVKVKVNRSVVFDSCDPWTIAHQAPLSMGLSTQEYWSGLPCPPTGDLPDAGTEPRYPTLQVGALPSEPPGKLTHWGIRINSS